MYADVKIAEGSHVWRSEDGFYREWSELSQDQQQQFIKARDAMKKAFSGCGCEQ
jgi:hypothetical protein